MTSKPGYKVFRGDPERRFWQKVDPPNDEGCLHWTGSLSTNGYGQFRSPEGPVVSAHRWIYEQTVRMIGGTVGPLGEVRPGSACCHVGRLGLRHLVVDVYAASMKARRPTLTGRAPVVALVVANMPGGNGAYAIYGISYPSSKGRRECRECKRLRSAAFDAKRRLARALLVD